MCNEMIVKNKNITSQIMGLFDSIDFTVEQRLTVTDVKPPSQFSVPYAVEILAQHSVSCLIMATRGR